MSEEQKQESIQQTIEAALKNLRVDLKEDLKKEILAAINNQEKPKLAVVESKPKEAKEPKVNRKGNFDPQKPRAVWRKVRCIGNSDNGTVPAPGETSKTVPLDAGPGICGTVYNKVLEYHDNLHSIDIKATKDVCPTCGGHKWEELASFTQHSPDSPNVTVHRSRKGI